jgi:hypothetical protein
VAVHCRRSKQIGAPTRFSGSHQTSQIRKTLYIPSPMKTIILAVVLFAAFAVTAMAADAAKPKKAKEPKKALLKHVVAFKFKEGTSKEDIAKVEDEFKALKKKIAVIKTFEHGTNNSPENLNKGFTHGWILTFDSKEDRDTYLHHPDHTAFADLAKSKIEDVFVMDFWTK